MCGAPLALLSCLTGGDTLLYPLLGLRLGKVLIQLDLKYNTTRAVTRTEFKYFSTLIV
ncbi:hypothetical protein DPMN_181797 [Dreissena polymorpha]|uniref:Uncharacterized protein n=1 Tax=Dreissena polymorpha TaxID=45954 RepID=A0A9D4I5M2_DREPO|nr:hypothetical protein DPMN_181797 [Dreissena polymorpha]